MEVRRAKEVRTELQKYVQALDELAKVPYIAAYLLLKAKLEKYRLQTGNANQTDENITNMANVLLLAENNSPDNSLKSYNYYLSKKGELEAELKLARDKEFVDNITNCSHIFYTGLDQHNRISTTCLCCGVSSNNINHNGLTEDYKNQFDYLYDNLFSEGKYLEYILVSREFATLEEAKYYYKQASTSGEANPLEKVERMLQLKNYERR